MPPARSPRSFSLRSALVHVPAGVGIPMALALLLFLLGPRASVDESVVAPEVGADPDGWVARAEAAVPGIRPGDQAAVVRSYGTTEATDLSLVFLHGFSADRHELDPVPTLLADSLGAHLFYARLTGHGQDGAAMARATAGDWLQDATDAVAVAGALGERIVLVGSSTGATLALWAALKAPQRERIGALVLLSPNFHPADRQSRLLLLPWGGLLARLSLGAERCFSPVSPEQERHWTTCYPSDALLPMMALVERIRTEDLSALRTPTLVLYSPADQVVDPLETERYFGELGAEPKRLVPIERAGPANHVLAGDIVAPENTDRVVREALAFLEAAGLR